MKILRRDGQKVLEAPIDPDFVFFQERIVIELRTVDRGTLYLMSLDIGDVAQLQEIFTKLQEQTGGV
jgi:hypothetical protein